MIRVDATCRCGDTWLEGIWPAGEKAVSRQFCLACGAPPPHKLTAAAPLPLLDQAAITLPSAALEAFVCGSKR
jgi:hypothetical protein